MSGWVGVGDSRKLDRAWVGPWVVYPKAKRAVPYDGPILNRDNRSLRFPH